MKTSKPFATISYNTIEFLTNKLEDLIRSRKIDFYCFVEHFAEEDEKKPHKHLFIIPNGKIDTDQVINCLEELDFNNISKPLKCMRPQSSKFGDWYLYSLHDTSYLASKGQARKYHYLKEDLICSDEDYLNELIHQIDYTKYQRFNVLKIAALNGESFEDLLLNGVIPIQQVHAFKFAYELMTQTKLERNRRENHEEEEKKPDN